METRTAQLLVATYQYATSENASVHALHLYSDVARQLVADLQPAPAVETWLAASTNNYLLALACANLPEPALSLTANGAPATVAAFVQAFVTELEPQP